MVLADFKRCFQASPEQSYQPRTESEVLLAISDHARREFPKQLRVVLSEEFDRVLYNNLKTDRVVDVAQTVLNRILTSFPSAIPDGGAVQPTLAGHGGTAAHHPLTVARVARAGSSGGSNSSGGYNIESSTSRSDGSAQGAATNPPLSPGLGDTYAAVTTRAAYSPAPAQTTFPIPPAPPHSFDIFRENVLDPLGNLNLAIDDLLPSLYCVSDQADSGYWSLGLPTAGECPLPLDKRGDACGLPALSDVGEDE